MSAPKRDSKTYTRKSTDEGLKQEFNSLDAKRESAEAYIKSQQHESWICLPDRYDDGGFTGGNMERPALRRLMADIEAGRISTAWWSTRSTDSAAACWTLPSLWQSSTSTRSHSFWINQLLIFFPLHRSAILMNRNQLVRIVQVLIAEDNDMREPLNGSL